MAFHKLRQREAEGGGGARGGGKGGSGGGGGAAAVASRNPLAAPGVLVELAAVGEQQHWQRRKEDAL